MNNTASSYLIPLIMQKIIETMRIEGMNKLHIDELSYRFFVSKHAIILAVSELKKLNLIKITYHPIEYNATLLRWEQRPSTLLLR